MLLSFLGIGRSGMSGLPADAVNNILSFVAKDKAVDKIFANSHVLFTRGSVRAQSLCVVLAVCRITHCASICDPWSHLVWCAVLYCAPSNVFVVGCAHSHVGR